MFLTVEDIQWKSLEMAGFSSRRQQKVSSRSLGASLLPLIHHKQQQCQKHLGRKVGERNFSKMASWVAGSPSVRMKCSHQSCTFSGRNSPTSTMRTSEIIYELSGIPSLIRRNALFLRVPRLLTINESTQKSTLPSQRTTMGRVQSKMASSRWHGRREPQKYEADWSLQV